MMNVKKNQVVKTYQHFSLLALLVGCFLFAAPGQVRATHIVGGEVTYKIIEKTADSIRVVVTLDVYRDCLFGADDAPFDDPANIGIFFGVQNFELELYRNLQIELSAVNDTLVEDLLDPCFVSLTEVCVHTTTYEGTITLPIDDRGYTFAYQRCCRNQTLVNIDDPLETGATFLVRLRNAAIERTNFSPVYKEWPPVYVCQGQPLLFDHGAVDDQDDVDEVLRYSLCTPFSGATEPKPMPLPADHTAYVPVDWKEGFGEDNVLGNMIDAQKLRIDSLTGVITAVPEAVGQYVVGVCVVEIDAATGDTLSIVRRDFQYNVNPCGERKAAIIVPEVQCDDLTVTFENDSANATQFQWFFPGALGSTTSTSMDTILQRTYPGPGTYSVTLIAEPNSFCADTTTQTFTLVDNTIEADFFVSAFDCDEVALLELQDFSVDSAANLSSYEWTITYGDVTLMASGLTAEVEVPLGVSGTVSLTVQSENSCTRTVTKPFVTGLDNPGTLIETELVGCLNETIELNPNTPDSISFNYQWAPAGLVSDPNAVNPTALITEPTTFTVTITPTDPVCEIIKTVTVTLGEAPVADFTSAVQCDGLTVQFNNAATNAVSYQWDFGTPDGDSSTAADTSFTFPELGDYEVQLLAISADGCVDSLTRTISLTDLSLSVDFRVEYGDCTSDALTFQLFDESENAANNTTGYFWELSDGQTSNAQNPTFTVTEPGLLEATLTVTTADDCEASRTKEIPVGVRPPVDQFPDQVALCLGDSYTFDPGGDPRFSYLWTPDTAIDDNTSPAPTIMPTENITYTVRISSEGVAACDVEETVEVIVIDSVETSLSFTSVEECDGATFSFVNTSTGTAGYRWDFGNGEFVEEAAGDTVVYTYPEPGDYTVTLSTIYDVDCVLPATAEVSAVEGTVMAAFTATIPDCADGAATIEFTNNSTNSFNNGLTYAWTFSNGTPATSSEENPVVTVTTDGPLIASLTATSGNGCDVTTTDTIDVTLINLGLAEELVLCPQDPPVALNPDGDTTLDYTWSPATGLSSTTDANPTADPAVTTTYFVTVSTTNATGPVCTIMDTVTVIVADDLAGFSISLTDTSGENGGAVQAGNVITTCESSVDLGTDLEDVAGVSIDWATTSGQNVGTGAMISYSPTGVDTLLVTATDALDCTATDTIIIINASPQISLPAEQPLCPGDTVALNPGGDPDLIYLWSPATGLDDPTSPNPLATPEVTTTYSVTVSSTLNGLTCTGEASTTVIITPTLEGFDISLETTTGPNGGSAVGTDGVITTCEPELNFTTGLNANDNVTVTWTDPAGNTLGTGVTLTGLSTAGQDTIIATAVDLESGCPPVMDTIIIAPNLISINPPTAGPICPGDTVALNAGGNPEFTYDWSPIGSTEPNPLVVPDVTSTYDVTVSNTLNGLTCSLEESITVEVSDPIGLDIGDGPIITCGEDVTLNGNLPAGSEGVSIAWTSAVEGDLGTSSSITVNPFQTDTIFATATDANGCTEMDTIVIIDNGVDIEGPGPIVTCQSIDTLLTISNLDDSDVLSYLWAPADRIDGSRTEMSANVLLTEVGSFEVSVTISNNKNCDTTLVIPVTIEEFNPSGLPAESVEACAGDSVQLNPGGNTGLIWEWMPAADLDLTDPFNPVVVASENATYSYTATDVGGCGSVSGEVMVNVLPAPSVTTGDDIVDCEGSVDLTAGTDAGATLTWYDNPAGEGTPLGTDSPLTLSPPRGVTTYYVIATNANGCASPVDSVTVTSDPLEATITPPQVFCEPTDTAEVFISGLADDQEYQFEWSTEELEGLGGTVELVEGTNVYSVTITNTIGCEQILSTMFDVVNLEDIEGMATPAEVLSGEPSTLMVTTCEDCSYEWTAPDGTVIGNSDMVTVMPTAMEPDTLAYLITVSKLGCTKTDTVPVFVLPVDCVPDRVYLPNAFTPNGDNNNDVLRLRSSFLEEIIEMELIVYDRWGEQVFRTTDPAEAWDGTFKGTLVGPDVYGYWLRVVCPNEEELIQKGNITVIR